LYLMLTFAFSADKKLMPAREDPEKYPRKGTQGTTGATNQLLVSQRIRIRLW